MKIRQLIGLCVLLILFLLMGAATKDISTWENWFVSWGIVVGVITAIVIGMFLLLNRDADEDIL